MPTPLSPPRSTAWMIAPARAVMDRLPYPQKFALISLLFALPLGVGIFLLFDEINDRIEFARKEMDGDAYLRPLRKLQAHINESRMTALAYAAGAIALRPDLVRRQAEMDADLREIDQAERRYGARLQTGPRLAVLKENRRFLKEKALTLAPADSDALHGKLLADVRDLISHVGDASNLILDPDLDSYYIMDAVLPTFQPSNLSTFLPAPMKPVRGAVWAFASRRPVLAFLLMRGEIAIEGKPGQGTVAAVRVPVDAFGAFGGAP